MKKLGNAGRIVVRATNFEENENFFEKLYGKPKDSGTSIWDTRFTLYCDGRQAILLNEDKIFGNYSGLLYFTTDIQSVIKYVESIGIQLTITEDDGFIHSVQFMSKDMININIVNEEHPDTPDPKTSKSTVDFGKFGEFAFKVNNLDESCEYWEELGYKILHRDKRLNYAIVSDEVFIVGLHGHDMDKSGITYFDPEMKLKTEKLLEKGIVFKSTGEKEDKNNRIAISPSGQAFYFFTGKI